MYFLLLLCVWLRSIMFILQRSGYGSKLIKKMPARSIETCCLSLLFFFFLTFELSKPLPLSVSPETRFSEALDGLFDYFWSVDPNNSDIGFFFSCGQIGGLGPLAKNWTECSCSTAKFCSDCYRWWDAISLESIADYGIHTNTTLRLDVAHNFYAHSPYNSHWKSCTFIDDFLWYGITYLKVYEWLNVS